MTTRLTEPPFDAFDAHCPSRRLLDTIGDKWASLVIVALGVHGSLRYSELSNRIAGVSQKMLTQTLRNLERDGLLTRTVTPSVPVRTDYELTPLGHSLLETLRRLKEWPRNTCPRWTKPGRATTHATAIDRPTPATTRRPGCAGATGLAMTRSCSGSHWCQLRRRDDPAAAIRSTSDRHPAIADARCRW